MPTHNEMMIVLMKTFLFCAAVVATHAFRLPQCSKRATMMTTRATIEQDTTTSGLNIEDMYADSPSEVNDKLLTGMPLPSWLNGALLRNGPGLFGAEKRRFDHIFDGLAKLTRYDLKEDGSVRFSTRFLRSNMYETVTDEGDISPGPYTGPVIPSFNRKQKIQGVMNSMTSFDNAVVNVHQIGETGPWVGITDAPVLMEFDPVTLETIGRLKAKDSITSLGGIELFSTAHPKSQNGYTYNIFLELRPVSLPFLPKGNLFHLVKTDRHLRRTVVGSITTAGNESEQGKSDVVPYMHDFSLTENYGVLCVWPLRMDLAVGAMSDRGAMRDMKWMGDDGIKTKIYVWNLHDNNNQKTPIASFEAPPMFAYHHINAYESKDSNGNGQLIVDVSGYQRPDIVNGEHAFAFIHNVVNPTLRKKQARDARYYRYTLPLSSRSVLNINPTQLLAQCVEGSRYTAELCTINPLYRGKRYRYSYGFTAFGGLRDDSPDSWGRDLWAIVKLDHDLAATLAEKETTKSRDNQTKPPAVTWMKENCYPTEPIFVPRPDGVDEDDGVILSQVYDGVKRETFLLVLQASDMSEIARYYTGMRCPISFHGQFVTNNKKQ